MAAAETASVMTVPLSDDQVGAIPATEVNIARGPPVETLSARGPPSVDYLVADPAAPPATTPASTLSPADLQSLADLALAMWSDALAAKGLALPAGAPTFLISDLADGVLGSYDHSTIRVDVDASGHGWFVDPTPRDASEFSLDLGTNRLGAAPGSAAAGAMDLLTVVLHEIGHWAGYDHDSGVPLMAAVLGTGQRVLLDLDGTAGPASDQPVAGALFDGATVNLANATAADPTLGITITIGTDGRATVSGALDNTQNGTSAGPVTSIIGNVLNRFRLVAPDQENTWHLTGLNTGDLTSGALGPIHFTSIDYLNGGNAKDTFVIDQLAGVTGDIDDGAGTLALQLFDFLYVSVDGGFDFTTATGDLVRNDSYMYSDVTYRVLSATGVDAFVGNGPPSDPSAVGLSLTDVNFSLVLFADDEGTVYTALKTSGGAASVVGVPDLLLNAWSFGVQLNQTSDTAHPNRVLDFDDGADDAVAGIPVTPLAGPAIDFEGENGSLLDVVGSASVDIAGAVIIKGTFELAAGQVSSADLPSGTGHEADALALMFTGVDVFVGVGGSLNNGGTPDDYSDDTI
jgi:hypothetical protein